MTLKAFFVELLHRMELGGVSKKQNLYAYNDLKQTSPVHFIIFLAIQDCWNWLKNKRNDSVWLLKEIRPAEVRFIRKRVLRFFGSRMRNAYGEIDSHEYRAGDLHLRQAERALDIFRANFVYVCDSHNIVYWKKVTIDFPLP